MKTLRFLALTGGLLSIAMLSSCTPFIFQVPLLQSLSSQSSLSQSASPQSLALQYYSPLQNAEYVSKAATIVVRYGPVLSNQNLDDLKFVIQGSKSGLHAGQTILADDHKTVIFKPANPFTPGEQVTVNVNSLHLDSQTIYPPFRILSRLQSINSRDRREAVNYRRPPLPPYPPRSAFPNFLTVPQDIPHYMITMTSPKPRRRGYLCGAFLLDQSEDWILSADSE